MYNRIMVPVDLKHLENLGKALSIAAKLAKAFDSEIIYASVSAAAPSEVAHDPNEFAAKLNDFAVSQAANHGIKATSSAIISHDPAVDLDASLIECIEANRADLVVMGTHQPGFAEHFFSSNAGHVANNAPVSVMVVR